MNISTAKIEDYDVVILGSGEAGKYLAWTLAKKACAPWSSSENTSVGPARILPRLPSKNVIHSAKSPPLSAKRGIWHQQGKPSYQHVRRPRPQAQNGGWSLVEVHLENATGAELLIGSGKFIAPRTIEVTFADGTSRILRGGKVVISTGSRATVEAIPGLREANPLTHIETLELITFPPTCS